VNQLLLNTLHPDDVDVVIQRVEEAEVDEMWSCVGKKHEQRWLWHAIDHYTGRVLAYVFGRRKEICQSYYDSRESLYFVAACGNHECIGFVKALTVVSTSARRPARRCRMFKPDNSPPRLCPSALPKPRALRRRRCLSSGRRSRSRRVGA
jgi:IS1 transposase